MKPETKHEKDIGGHAYQGPQHVERADRPADDRRKPGTTKAAPPSAAARA